MPGFLHFEAQGFRDVDGRFARRTPLLARRRREAIRNVGRMGTEALRKTAPKRTGQFARDLFFRSYDRGSMTFVKVYAGGEHAFVLDFLRYGTRAHEIPLGGSAAQMAKGYPLRFYWEKGPQGPGVYRFWSVNHPGTQPDPFIDEAMADVEDDMLAELRKVAASVARLS